MAEYESLNAYGTTYVEATLNGTVYYYSNVMDGEFNADAKWYQGYMKFPSVSKTGYTYNGYWKSGSHNYTVSQDGGIIGIDTIYCDTLTKTSNSGFNASFSATPSFSIKKYNITYKSGSGTGSSIDEKKEYGKNYTIKRISSFDFTAPTGKEFDYWLGSDGKHYSGGETYSTNANLTLTAQWKDSGPVVILDGNGRVFAHNQSVSIVSHAYLDDSGTQYGVRGTPLIENSNQLNSFKGYYTTPTFKNAVKIYDLYQYNGGYLKNSDTSVKNYATVAVENTNYFGPATGTLATTAWVTESGIVVNPLPNIPSWKGNLTETLHLYALWSLQGSSYVTKFQYGDNLNQVTTINNEGASNLTSFIIASPDNFENYTPTGKRFVGWKCTNDNKVYHAGDTYYLGKFGETTFTFQAQYAQIETVVNLYGNGGYFGNDTTDIGPKYKTYVGGSYVYAYRGQPKHPKGWAFLGYFDSDGRQVYEPYEGAWYSTVTPQAAKATGDGIYFSSTSTTGTKEILDEGGVQFHSDPPTTEDLSVYVWDYRGEENEINLYARWKSPSNAYIYDGDNLETAYIYINKVWPNHPQEEDWVQVDGANFF